ncbi:MAG: hypothetical protein AB8H79_19395 [Myxococcota bacterium]
MKSTVLSRVAALATLCFATTAVVGLAYANSFEAATQKSGCASIVFDGGESACKSVQSKKNNVCNQPGTCDARGFSKLVDEYEEAKENLESGKVAAANKSKLEDKVEDLKEKLDDLKDKAADYVEIGEECVKARASVQEWFESVAIRGTTEARDDAIDERKRLLGKLEDAQDEVRDTKKVRDAKPTDSRAESEWESATDDLRDVEAKLEKLNKKYGKSISDNADRLVKKYKDEAEKHEGPSEQAQGRRDKCKKVLATRY